MYDEYNEPTERQIEDWNDDIPPNAGSSD